MQALTPKADPASARRHRSAGRLAELADVRPGVGGLVIE
jgi:hypothetical protein